MEHLLCPHSIDLDFSDLLDCSYLNQASAGDHEQDTCFSLSAHPGAL